MGSQRASIGLSKGQTESVAKAAEELKKFKEQAEKVEIKINTAVRKTRPKQ